jgi:ubiquinone/menaquinone biosynthesis C-methylase UbiE
MTSVDWSSYAEVYDLMSRSNPAYQDVVKLVEHRANQWELAPNASVVELGAGTGNISLMLAQLLQSKHIVHVDSDRAMIVHARHKANELKLNNVKYLEQDVNTVTFNSGSLDVIVLVHALYTFKYPNVLITQCHEWLKPGGILFICDIGKALNIMDWARYLFTSMTRDYGLAECLKRFYMGRAVARQNRRIARAQRDGTYWTHTLQQLETCVLDIGFAISTSGTSYRGYSNWLEAVKKVDA